MNSARTSFVTGGASGVGAATVKRFAARGDNVVIADIDLEAAEDLANEVSRSYGTECLAVLTDVTDRESGDRAVAAVQDTFGRLDVLVNNAGAWEIRPFEETSQDHWSLEIRLNFVGVLHGTQALLPHLKGSPSGRIVSVISEAARIGERNTAVYAGAKAAIIGFSRSLAREVGPQGLTVNCVSLAVTRTPAHGATLDNDGLVAKMVRSYPVGRLGEPEDAAGAIAYLTSVDAGFVTGQVLGVNGGYAMV